uniref:Uncharacterized protein n=1 Tax=Cacopsylla melanoneura TaxID=428564 RepID=A0A8D8YKC4_9HEMI
MSARPESDERRLQVQTRCNTVCLHLLRSDELLGSPNGIVPGSENGIVPGSENGIVPGSPNGIEPGSVNGIPVLTVSVERALDTLPGFPFSSNTEDGSRVDS